MINDHLAAQDEDLAFNLISIVDCFKNIDDSDDKETQDLTEAAFALDERLSINLSQSMSQVKKRQIQQ